MTTWIIEPREPVILRDGRPFTHQPGVTAATLPFPFPSTTAGAARSRAGSKQGVFSVTPADLPKLKTIGIRGPLLAAAHAMGDWTLLAPAPADALLLEHEKLLRCRRMEPFERPNDTLMKPFERAGNLALLPIGPSIYDPAKPAKKQPAFWHWNIFEEWLLNPEQKLDGGLFSRDTLGIQPLPQDERIHIALEHGMMVAREGALFETRGLEFTNQPEDGMSLASSQRLALWLDVEESTTYAIQPGFDSLGGERRLVNWQSGQSPDVPSCPKELCEHIVKMCACRLILLTPAYFQEHGYLLDASRLEHKSVKPQLRAALVGRPQVVSGWDLASQNGIKPTRRLVPAGSVFFLQFANQPENEDIRTWIQQIWMHCISHDPQDCRDGFGLAVLGTWDGKPQPMYDPRKSQSKEVS